MKKSYVLIGFLLLATLIVACGKKEKNSGEVSSVKEILDRIAAWQMSHFSFIPESDKGNHHDYGFNSWTNAVFLFGLSEWAPNSTKGASYYDWLMEMGDSGKWQIAANFKDHPRYQLYHADELCVGQFYLNMYDKFRDNKMLQSVKERVDWIMANPPDSSMGYRNKQAWTWCDALFMAPPVYTRLTAITGKTEYTTFMHSLFMQSYTHLYDGKEHLFFRDGSYFAKQEANGEKVFWGRGNGWVLAGLANILTYLPKDAEHRPFYEKLFVELAGSLKKLQDEEGFWHASLLDPQNYPAPETSATALITYALLYGVNNDLLGRDYTPSIRKSWQSLCSVVNEQGKIGWVQPIGADPKKVTEEMTAVYGAGAFLLAGNEMIKFLNHQ